MTFHRLLRARGDRPRWTVRLRRRGQAPPRSRRSTREREARARRREGSSALAEIDPTAGCHRRGRAGLLRARGDRPSSANLRAASGVAPPRSRRSTLRDLDAMEPADGSSALAEIDPVVGRRARERDRLLRARGDRPGQWAPRFPPPRLLRARGDRPSSAPEPAVALPAPPRSRRSTPLRARSAGPCRGSSALAEIDPPPIAYAASSLWLLRARGDRPALPARRHPR